jgi:hypothetical protein
MIMKNQYPFMLAMMACVLSLSPATSTLAEEDVIEDAVEDGSVRCIDTRRISRTTVVDPETILFYMRGGDIYRNTLPRKCTSLAREKRFSYRTTVSRLCNIDVITVLYDAGGLTRGPSCGLGMFHPVTKEEAEAIRKGPDAEITPEPIDPADVEEPQVEIPGEETEE